MDILIFILILSFLVLIHELGHFFVAKRLGVMIEEFGLGYPPRALILFKKWGTNFTLNWIPFGGFVKMKGEFAETENEVVPSSKKKAAEVVAGDFSKQSGRSRMAIILAGATVNFLFGILCFSVVFSLMGIPSSRPIVSEVMSGSPAAVVGLPTKVQVTAIKVAQEYVTTATYEQVTQLLRAHPGETITLRTIGPCEKNICQNTVQEYTVALRPAAEITDNQGPLGVAFETRLFYPWYQMPFRGAWFGLQQAFVLGWTILQGLSTMLSNLVTRGIIPQDVAGPVGIVHQAQESGLFRQGFSYLILFSGMLSINLAVMNVLPIPALDGGRAVFIILEKIIGRKKVAHVEGYANYGGFAVLLLLIVLVTIRDVARILQP